MMTCESCQVDLPVHPRTGMSAHHYAANHRASTLSGTIAESGAFPFDSDYSFVQLFFPLVLRDKPDPSGKAIGSAKTDRTYALVKGSRTTFADAKAAESNAKAGDIDRAYYLIADFTLNKDGTVAPASPIGWVLVYELCKVDDKDRPWAQVYYGYASDSEKALSASALEAEKSKEKEALEAVQKLNLPIGKPDVAPSLIPSVTSSATSPLVFVGAAALAFLFLRGK